MSAHNPAVILQAIEAVAFELRRGGAILQSSVDDTAREQSRSEENAGQARQLAVVVA